MEREMPKKQHPNKSPNCLNRESKIPSSSDQCQVVDEMFDHFMGNDFSVFNYYPIPTIIVDNEANVIYHNFNNHAIRLQMPSIGCFSLNYDDKKLDIDILHNIMDCIQTDKKKTFIKIPDGKQYLDITISPFPIGAIISIQDITKYKMIENIKEKNHTQLLQYQKIEAVEMIAGSITHDFNNIITAIRGWIDMVLWKVDEQNEIHQDLIEVRDATFRASNLISQLNTLKQNHSDQLTETDLNQCINDSSKSFKEILGNNIKIKKDLEKNLWKIQSDHYLIHQIMLNLISNAKDAMPDGGFVHIKTENLILDESESMLNPEASPGHFIRLSISDTGIGMDSKTIRHIFDPFYTNKLHGKGNGLGLSIVYRIVKKAKGWIEVESELGKGSKFIIYVPISFENQDKVDSKMKKLKNIQGNGERILLVEDEKSTREYAEKALTRNKYRVVSASSFKEAMNLFQKQDGDFHLVFSDVVLPDKNGIDLIDRLLKKKEDLQILLSSGYEHTDTELQWSKICKRGYPFLQKPYTPKDLLQAIKIELIKRSTPNLNG